MANTYLNLLVNASSFNPSGITIQSVHNATIATDQYTLTGGLLTSLTLI